MFGRKKEKTGHWIRREHLFGAAKYVCSVCGAVFDVTKDIKRAGICPNCRAKMKKKKLDPRWIEEMELYYDE